MELKPALRGLRQSCGVIASAIISRDGLVIAADMPDGISVDTFAIMSATLLGAASTANSELRVGMPTSVVVESEDARLLIVGAGRKALVVAVLPKKADTALAVSKLTEIAETIKTM